MFNHLKKKIPALRGFLLGSFLISLISCSGMSLISFNDTQIPVESVAISGSSSCYPGEGIQLTTDISPEEATETDVTWSSSDTVVLTVSSSGLVTAESVGTATITVTTVDGSHEDIHDVEVLEDLPGTASTVADHSIMRKIYDQLVPESAIQTASDTLKIGYGHTSHGGQLISGMNGLVEFANDNMNSYSDDLFQWSLDGSTGLHLFRGSGYDDGYLAYDCGYVGWEDRTRDFLDDHPDYNVIMWAWCGELSYLHDVQSHYIDNMVALEAEYPQVTFIYMTGHVDEPYEDVIRGKNDIIREHCRTEGKWLFDFADIEKYDLDGNYFGDKMVDDTCFYDSDGNGVLEQPAEDWMDPEPEHDGNWAIEWQESHEEGVDWYDCSSAHSQPLSANQKTYSLWWLFARVAGWQG